MTILFSLYPTYRHLNRLWLDDRQTPEYSHIYLSDLVKLNLIYTKTNCRSFNCARKYVLWRTPVDALFIMGSFFAS